MSGVRPFILSALILIIACANPMAATLQVPSTAYPTIQAGLDAASAGDTVLVADGEYTGEGNWDLDFNSKGIVLASAGDDPDVCIIRGSSSYPDEHRVFVFVSGEDSTAVVRGFTITEGFMGEIFLGAGGGVFCVDSSPTFINCTITECSASLGGGVYCSGSSSRFEDCRISLNYVPVGDGGGVFITAGSSVTFDRCFITDNYAHDYFDKDGYGFGAGIYLDDNSTLKMRDSEISGNRAAEGAGGGLFAKDSHVEIQGTLFSDNIASESCGGLSLSNVSGWIAECIISGNSADEEPINGFYGGISVSGPVTIRETGIMGNSATGGGGGIGVGSGDVEVTGCRIQGNNALWAAGVLLGSSEPATFTNCLISENRALDGGGGIFMEGSPGTFVGCTITRNHGVPSALGCLADTLMLEKCIIWDNCGGSEVLVSGPEGVVFFACSDLDSSRISFHLGGTVEYIGENIFTDPLFCDPDTCSAGPSLEGDYRLHSDSPCLPGASPCGELIGALPVGCPVASAPPTTLTRLASDPWPNPTSGAVSLRLQAPVGANSGVRVIDASGRLTRTLTPAGGRVTWDGRLDDGRPAPSGVYYFKIPGHSGRSTRSVLVVR